MRFEFSGVCVFIRCRVVSTVRDRVSRSLVDQAAASVLAWLPPKWSPRRLEDKAGSAATIRTVFDEGIR